MQATAPLWLTLLLAVLAPVLSLGGVLWTQHAADKRAEHDADWRERAEHARWLTDQRRDCYVRLLVSTSAYYDASSAWSEGDAEANRRLEEARHEMWSAHAAVTLLGSERAAAAADKYSVGLTRDAKRRGKDRVPLSHGERHALRKAFEETAKDDLGAEFRSFVESR